MGVYPRKDHKDHIVEVSKRAGTFLEEIHSLLPEKFSTRYKNPCWSAEQPKDYPAYGAILLPLWSQAAGRGNISHTSDYRNHRFSVFECTSVGMYNVSKRNTEFMDAESQVMIGLYIVHIKKWLEFYPIENFLFIKMEDILKDSFRTMSEITEFLGLSPITSREVAENLLEKKMNVMRE